MSADTASTLIKWDWDSRREEWVIRILGQTGLAEMVLIVPGELGVSDHKGGGYVWQEKP